MSSNNNEHILTYDPLAMYYDLFYPKDEDVNFYLEAAKDAGEKVLELCCGTGRLLIPLAKHGFEVTGVDLSSKMLSIARKKISQLGPLVQQKIRLINGDIRKVVWSSNFNLVIIAFSAFMELPSKEDRLTVLKKCFDSLKADGGMLAMDNFYQNTTDEFKWGPDSWDGKERFIGSYPSPVKDNVTIKYFDSNYFDEEARLAKKVISVEHIDQTGSIRRESIDVIWYYVTPEEIKEELQQAGFQNVELFGSFERHLLYDKALMGKGRQIIIARR